MCRMCVLGGGGGGVSSTDDPSVVCSEDESTTGPWGLLWADEGGTDGMVTSVTLGGCGWLDDWGCWIPLLLAVADVGDAIIIMVVDEESLIRSVRARPST